MFNIDFYETYDGHSDIQEFLDSLRVKAASVKDARIQYGQIARCIELLQENGTNLPVQIAKHLDEEIWELRPGDNRVLFFYFNEGTYVLLHHFRKKTQKTPPREIARAKSEMKDYIARKEAKQ
ncbi:type II toxin-antitoxin system RelE/ParE family toxin [Oribacterium sp. NK2B42]|uniref:type II toxin-antitoxin system RelE/ParE family toxin n=1 Tax=Oribacterium sp. NK2B42 TaxID=689781 RepID=UPI0004078EED|nr:type II toxin-antitoxin system RelE/ParE family toxin [Oribacterium sp. NK2B42]